MLCLPGTEPICVLSVYSPPKNSGEEAPFRRSVEHTLYQVRRKFKHIIAGGDFNTALDTTIDQHGMKYDTDWPWLRGEAQCHPPTLIDSFRFLHPHLRKYTRCRSTFDSESTLDYIFCSPSLTESMPILDSDILDWTVSDHQPCSATLQTRNPVASLAPPKPSVFRSLKKSEVKAFQLAIQDLDQYCENHQHLVTNTPTAEVACATDSLVHQISSSYHSFTDPRPSTKENQRV